MACWWNACGSVSLSHSAVWNIMACCVYMMKPHFWEPRSVYISGSWWQRSWGGAHRYIYIAGYASLGHLLGIQICVPREHKYIYVNICTLYMSPHRRRVTTPKSRQVSWEGDECFPSTHWTRFAKRCTLMWCPMWWQDIYGSHKEQLIRTNWANWLPFVVLMSCTYHLRKQHPESIAYQPNIA